MNKSKSDYRIVFLLSFLYALALLVFSCYTSPLYPNYFGFDSAIFSLVGKGVKEGKALYAELFDHKGPLIFFANAIGHYLGGRFGIFLVQCVSGMVSVFFMYRISCLMRPEGSKTWNVFLCFFCTYSVFFYTFQRGNLTEEYAMPFISVALYYMIKYALHTEDRVSHPPMYAFAYGICFAVLAFFRLNNAVSIAAGVLAIILYLLCKKEYGNIALNIVSGLAGVLVVAIPIVAYFYLSGSLEQMVYATFLHNFVIAGNTGRSSFMEESLKFTILYFPFVICMILGIMEFCASRRLKFLDILLHTICGFNLISLCIANRFPHYFAVFTPVYLAYLLRYLRFDKRSFARLAVIGCCVVNLALAGGYSLSSINDIYIEQSSGIRHETLSEDFSKIPEAERSSVIGYNIPASDYLSGDIIPCYKYYTLQETWSITNPTIQEEFFAWLSTSEPLWLLVTPHEDNERVGDIIREKYELKYENDYLEFYRLKD